MNYYDDVGDTTRISRHRDAPAHLPNNKWSMSNLTKGRIAAEHGRFNRIHRVAPTNNAFRTHESPHPEQHFDRFSRFCTAHDHDRPTDRPTNHATPSVTIGRIYVRSTAMRPIIIAVVIITRTSDIARMPTKRYGPADGQRYILIIVVSWSVRQSVCFPRS